MWYKQLYNPYWIEGNKTLKSLKNLEPLNKQITESHSINQDSDRSCVWCEARVLFPGNARQMPSWIFSKVPWVHSAL